MKLRINGTSYEAEVEPRTLLSDFIRDQGLTGTNLWLDSPPSGPPRTS